MSKRRRPSNPAPLQAAAPVPRPDPAAVALAQTLRQAHSAYQKGALADAERLCAYALALQPEHFDALFLLGVVAARTGRADAAAQALARAVAVKSDHVDARVNLGVMLDRLGRHGEALAAYDHALALAPEYAEAWFNRGNALRDLQRPGEAMDSIARAIALKPRLAEAHNNLGTLLREAKRNDEALAAFDRALAVNPGYADAHNNRGVTLRELGRPAEALAAYDRALAIDPRSIGAHTNRGVVLAELRRYAEAIACHERALTLNPGYADAWYNRGLALHAMHRLGPALESLEHAIAQRPGFAEALTAQGSVLVDLHRHDEALECYGRALALAPDDPDLLGNRGIALEQLRRHVEAIAEFRRALAVRPGHAFLQWHALNARMHICDWSGYAQDVADLRSALEHGTQALPPFFVLSLPTTPAMQKSSAERWVRDRFPASSELPAIARRPRRDRIRIGYFSADFRDHPVAHLMAEVYEHHDRGRFELTGVSFGADTGDAMRQRLTAAFDRFVDAGALGDREVAELARKLELDIAVDLSGFTLSGRPGVFAHRAAPIQVSYLGYPGTMGAGYIDYVLADAVLIPEADRRWYTEKTVCMPSGYHAADSQLRPAATNTTRGEAGLPGSAFVFCSFNANYKITPDWYDTWMRILARVDGSVLWLLADNPDAAANLAEEAARRGVDPARLVFADRAPRAEHLARLPLADLFLDTLPYNAGSTASDALRMGVPVLTCAGDTYAGRVAASMLRAARLPELVTAESAEFEAKAAELATHPSALRELRQRLATALTDAPLFATAAFTRHLETAYTAMHGRHLEGLPPDHIQVRA
jgi:protein O-GlcNAc transferase